MHDSLVIWSESVLMADANTALRLNSFLLKPFTSNTLAPSNTAAYLTNPICLLHVTIAIFT
jgi:hypothetical protein